MWFLLLWLRRMKETCYWKHCCKAIYYNPDKLVGIYKLQIELNTSTSSRVTTILTKVIVDFSLPDMHKIPQYNTFC